MKEKVKPHAVNGEPLFTKQVIVNLFMYLGMLFVAIASGITVYIFFLYAYMKLFTDYSFISIINVGGIGIMFYVTWRLFNFYKYQYEHFRRTFRWALRESTPFVSASKRKIKELKKPDEDWIDKE